MARRRRIRREDLDVEMFPCAVAGCGDHAAGWADRELLTLMRIELAIDPDLERVYLCRRHLAPVRSGGGRQ